MKEIRSSNFHELQHRLALGKCLLRALSPWKLEERIWTLPCTSSEDHGRVSAEHALRTFPTVLGALPSPLNKRGNWGLLGSRPLSGCGSRPAGLSPATRVGHPSPLCGARKRSVRLSRPPSFPPGRYLRMSAGRQVQEKAAWRSCNPALQQAGFQPAQARLDAANGRAVPSDHSQSEGRCRLG